MLTLCTGHTRKRIKLDCTRFYSHHELFKKIRDLHKSIPIWFEFGPNLYQSINTDSDLRFACQIVERDIESYMSSEDQEENRRMIIDQAHTKDCEIREARRQRKEAQSTNTYHTHPVKKTRTPTCTLPSNVVPHDHTNDKDKSPFL
jgi:hypothetical protein